MIKIQIDPITKKVLGYTKVQDNTQVYSTDLLISETDLSDVNITSSTIYTEDGFGEDDCETSIQKINEQINKLQGTSESDFFMTQIIDGNDIDSARKSVLSRRENLESLQKEKDELIKSHDEHIKNYYLEKNQINDSVLTLKYYSSVILLIKNENRYLQEWLDWHLGLGFEHVYIYDNGTTEKVQDIINLYSEEIREKITVIDWSGHHTHIQQDAYNHFLENYKQDVRWGLFIDSDEFLRFTDGVTTNVNEFLKSYEDYTEIWGYEVEYDANGQEVYEDKPVRERFTRQTDVKEGFYWKNFIQVNRIDSFKMHYAYYDESKHLMYKNNERNKDLFVIDHYYTKSWEEWQWKIKERGGADPYYHKALKEFFIYNPDMSYLDTGENIIQAYE